MVKTPWFPVKIFPNKPIDPHVNPQETAGKIAAALPTAAPGGAPWPRAAALPASLDAAVPWDVVLWVDGVDPKQAGIHQQNMKKTRRFNMI